MDDCVIKYYIWKDDERFTEEGFENMDEAIEYAIENKCTEVERTEWDSEEAYQNREPADRFRTVWSSN